MESVLEFPVVSDSPVFVPPPVVSAVPLVTAFDQDLPEEYPLVVLSVALGGMIGDQVLYLCGRRFGGKLLRRFSKHQDKIERAQKLIQRHPYLFVIGTRFMYGFRVIGPTLIGASQLPPKIFLPLNILGAFAWALIFTTIGYAGGQVIAPWLHNLDQHLKHWVWLILVVVLVVGVRWWLKRRGKKKPDNQA